MSLPLVPGAPPPPPPPTPIDPLPVAPFSRPFDAVVVPPGSKSLTNRFLLLAALARGTSVLRRPLTDADDAQRMLAAISALGAGVTHLPVSTAGSAPFESVRINGVGGTWTVPPAGVTLDLGNAGTATRFLAAAALLTAPGSGPIVIDGNPRMRQRPIAELADALGSLGARVEFLARPGYPPLRVHPALHSDLRAAAAPARVVFDTTQSSQFISAVFLVAPFLPAGLLVRFRGEVTSVSYVRMTLALLRRMGVNVRGEPPGEVFVPHTPIAGFDVGVEPDASGATYFWAAAALHPGSRVRTPGLGTASLQEDARFVDLLERMGARVGRALDETVVEGRAPMRAIHADLSLMPDAALTLAAVCCFADGPSELFGLRTLRVKESDRLEALRTELSRAGARVEIIRRVASGGLAGGGGGEGGRAGRRGPAHRTDPCEPTGPIASPVDRVRHLRRPPHGDVVGAGVLAPAGVLDRRPGVCGEDIPRLLVGL